MMKESIRRKELDRSILAWETGSLEPSVSNDNDELYFTDEEVKLMAWENRQAGFEDSAMGIFYDDLECFDQSLFREISNLSREEAEDEEYGREIREKAKKYWSA